MGKDDSASRIIAGMPMYNEEETIGTVVTMALRYVDEVICIDDGSSDSSARIAEACGATVIRHRSNQGYGAALKTLFQTTSSRDTDVLVVLDSDGQHDTSDIPKLVQPILDGEADFTIGSRFVEGGEGNSMPAYRRLGIKVITAASNLTSDLGIKDPKLRDILSVLKNHPKVDTLIFTGGNSKNGPEYFMRKVLKKAKISDQLWGVLSLARPGPPHLAHAHAPASCHPRMHVYDQFITVGPMKKL